MEEIFNRFREIFNKEDKEEAVVYIMDKVSSGEIDVIDLYTGILTPLLNNLECSLEDKNICIWKEHVKTAIVRTIVECCYPYVVKKRDELGRHHKGTAVVLCPPDEYHDLGARMVADFFTICGFDAVFVGGNTPYRDFYNAIYAIKPDFVAISVSNYYHLVATKKMIEEIKQAAENQVKFVVGGYAFHDDRENKVRTVGADFYAESFNDIANLTECEVVK